mmetsp:Transcript_117894/g.367356  ORF Transcript_117894/g.367356 Transcript_117894/m.367356 type:complete len:200 (+) Transcript_117894:359-958(+)
MPTVSRAAAPTRAPPATAWSSSRGRSRMTRAIATAPPWACWTWRCLTAIQKAARRSEPCFTSRTGTRRRALWLTGRRRWSVPSPSMSARQARTAACCGTSCAAWRKRTARWAMPRLSGKFWLALLPLALQEAAAAPRARARRTAAWRAWAWRRRASHATPTTRTPRRTRGTPPRPPPRPDPWASAVPGAPGVERRGRGC